MIEITNHEIEAGAEALRQRLQGGKQLTPWDSLPNTPKKKWRDYAAVVLTAAARANMALKGGD